MYYTDGSAAGITSFGRRDNVYEDSGAVSLRNDKNTEKIDVEPKAHETPGFHVPDGPKIF